MVLLCMNFKEHRVKLISENLCHKTRLRKIINCALTLNKAQMKKKKNKQNQANYCLKNKKRQ